MPIFDEAAAVEAMARGMAANALDLPLDAAWNLAIELENDQDYLSDAQAALAALKPFLGGMQRLKDCEMSLAIFDVGRSSEYWERHASPDKGGE